MFLFLWKKKRKMNHSVSLFSFGKANCKHITKYLNCLEKSWNPTTQQKIYPWNNALLSFCYTEACSEPSSCNSLQLLILSDFKILIFATLMGIKLYLSILISIFLVTLGAEHLFINWLSGFSLLWIAAHILYPFLKIWTLSSLMMFPL